jgi:hypothetical protein
MATDVEGTGTATWTVAFQEGAYHYQCDAHPDLMKGDLTVASAAPQPPTPPPPTPPPPTVRLATLVGTVGPGATIALKTPAGRKVVSVEAGPVVVRVRDLSTTQNFHLVGPGVNRKTTRLRKAKMAWKLTLKRGTYVYRSDANPRLRGSFKVV